MTRFEKRPTVKSNKSRSEFSTERSQWCYIERLLEEEDDNNNPVPFLWMWKGCPCPRGRVLGLLTELAGLSKKD